MLQWKEAVAGQHRCSCHYQLAAAFASGLEVTFFESVWALRHSSSQHFRFGHGDMAAGARARRRRDHLFHSLLSLIRQWPTVECLNDSSSSPELYWQQKEERRSRAKLIHLGWNRLDDVTSADACWQSGAQYSAGAEVSAKFKRAFTTYGVNLTVNFMKVPVFDLLNYYFLCEWKYFGLKSLAF